MQHIANTASGKLARTQQDLLRIALNSSPIKTEMMDHVICDAGFSQDGQVGLEKMDDQIFFSFVMSLLRSRPSSRLWDLVPDVPYTEDHILTESPDAYRMTFEQKAQFLRDEFVRRPKMVGFKIQLHNLERKTDMGTVGAPSVSFTIYESIEDLGNACIPISIKVEYRTNF